MPMMETSVGLMAFDKVLSFLWRFALKGLGYFLLPLAMAWDRFALLVTRCDDRFTPHVWYIAAACFALICCAFLFALLYNLPVIMSQLGGDDAPCVCEALKRSADNSQTFIITLSRSSFLVNLSGLLKSSAIFLTAFFRVMGDFVFGCLRYPLTSMFGLAMILWQRPKLS